MKYYYIYILLCSDGSYYTGITNNLDKRLSEHENGSDKGCYTFKRRPLKLVYHTVTNSTVYAINFEKQVKGWSRKKKEALIKGDFNALHELAKCQNDTKAENLSL